MPVGPDSGLEQQPSLWFLVDSEMLVKESKSCRDEWAPVWRSSRAAASQTLPFLRAMRNQWLIANEAVWLVRKSDTLSIVPNREAPGLYRLPSSQGSSPSVQHLLSSWFLVTQQHAYPLNCLSSIVREVIYGAIRTTESWDKKCWLARALTLHAPHATKVELIF